MACPRWSARHTGHAPLQMLFSFSFLSLFFLSALAQPAVLQFDDCFSGDNTTQKLSISTVYAQLFPQDDGRAFLNFTVLGTTPEVIVEASDSSEPVASQLASFRFPFPPFLTPGVFQPRYLPPRPCLRSRSRTRIHISAQRSAHSRPCPLSMAAGRRTVHSGRVPSLCRPR